QGLPYAIRSDRGSGQNAVSDPSAHAAPRLRLRPGERRPRHAGATGLARTQEHPAHGAPHRAVAASVQGLLAIIVGRGELRSPLKPRAGRKKKDPGGFFPVALNPRSLLRSTLTRAPPHGGQPRTTPSGPDIWALVGLSGGRRSGVAGARAYQLVFDLLLQRVCDPAGGAADREQGEGAAWFEAQ